MAQECRRSTRQVLTRNPNQKALLPSPQAQAEVQLSSDSANRIEQNPAMRH
jgi:hypothetical protein